MRLWRLDQESSPAQLKMSIYSPEILAIYMSFFGFVPSLLEASKPTNVLTDGKAVTRFFQTKAIPPFFGTQAIMGCILVF